MRALFFVLVLASCGQNLCENADYTTNGVCVFQLDENTYPESQVSHLFTLFFQALDAFSQSYNQLAMQDYYDSIGMSLTFLPDEAIILNDPTVTGLTSYRYTPFSEELSVKVIATPEIYHSAFSHELLHTLQAYDGTLCDERNDASQGHSYPENWFAQEATQTERQQTLEYKVWYFIFDNW